MADNYRTEAGFMPLGQIYYIWNVKRIASALLLALFLFNCIGYYAIFFTIQSENKAQMKKMVRNGKYLETIRIHKSELKNIVFKDHGKEFIWNGEMYDIKNMKNEGDHVVFLCINDKTEKMLIAGLKEQIRNNGGTDSYPNQKNSHSAKNPVKDLFYNTEAALIEKSVAVIYPAALLRPYTCLPPALNLPPPEVTFS